MHARHSFPTIVQTWCSANTSASQLCPPRFEVIAQEILPPRNQPLTSKEDKKYKGSSTATHLYVIVHVVKKNYHCNASLGKVFRSLILIVYSNIPSSVPTYLCTKSAYSLKMRSQTYNFLPSSPHPIPIVARLSSRLPRNSWGRLKMSRSWSS